MLYNTIEFSAPKNYLDLKEDLPTPVKTNLPSWYKKLSNQDDDMTVKKCMPFLETLTSGYLLKLPLDIKIKHNAKNNEGQRETVFSVGPNQHLTETANLNYQADHHSVSQIANSPFVKKNLNFSIYKIKNPWKIKTPIGYSCLFVPPLNNRDDRFEIFSGIVETDRHPVEINFPFCINGDKYPVLDTTLEKGTPYVQIIPFKREAWKMKISENKNLVKKVFSFELVFQKFYKNKIWKKTTWL